MMFSDVARSARRQRPLRSQPPMIAMSQRAPPGPRRTMTPVPRAGAGAAIGAAGLLQVGGERHELARPSRAAYAALSRSSSSST